MKLVRLRRLLLLTGLTGGFAMTAAAAPPELISVNSAGNDTGNDESQQQQLSANGRFVVFESSASNLGPTDTNGVPDVYVRDRQTHTTQLVSVNAAGTDGGNDLSTPLGISDDGRVVLFVSLASNLVTTPADTNGTGDIYLRDLQTGTTELISVNAAGTQAGNNVSNEAVLSRDGRFIAFSSHATDLGFVDNNGQRDVFVRDRQTGTTALISVNAAGTQTGNAPSLSPSAFSADGNIVAFASSASDLGPTDTNADIDIYVRNRSAGTTTLVSANAAGTNSGNNQATYAVVSGNGRFVAFTSIATNHSTTPDTNGQSDIYLRDLQTGVTRLLSTNAAGTDSAAGVSFAPSLSDDGRFIAFQTTAGNLGPVDSNGDFDVYLKDQQLGTTSLVSVNAAGTDSGAGLSAGLEITRDGRFVVFDSDAADLAGTDTNTADDVFRRDLQQGVTVLLSTRFTGTDSGNGSSSTHGRSGSVSSNGQAVLFNSLANNLAAADSNGVIDVFVADAPVAVHEPKLYLSPELPVLAGGILVGGQDVVSFSPQTHQYQRFFEGADVGLLLSNVDALDILPDGDLLLSFSLPTAVPGVGFVGSDDVVRFTPQSTGAHTSGSFSLFFDGDAHGIVGLGKNLDAIAYEDGVLAFSTSGLVVVDGLFVQNEDVVALNVQTNDAELLFDGSAFGLALANVDGLELLADGDLLLSFDTPVILPGLGAVADEDVVRFHPNASNPARSGTFSTYFDGSQNGWTGVADDVDAIAVD